jgi:S1-C subfamily serine protease
MTTAFSWICPACSRRVPSKLDQCRCGFIRDHQAAPSDQPPPRGASTSTPAARLVAAIALAGALGLAGWLVVGGRDQPAPAVTRPASTAAAPPPPAAPDAVAAPRAEPPAPAPMSRTERGLAPGPPAAVAAPAPAGSLEDVVARASTAVVQVETPRARGTGFFVRPDTIVTNAHVTAGDHVVRIRRADGETAEARVETVARDVDLAILRIPGPPPGQPLVPLGTAEQVRIGQEVMAIGSAMGVFQNTVTRGIVSGVRRAGPVTLVQTDAAINPGNSGGPLIDRNGNVIGITTMSVRSAQGISFAVAVDHARALLEGRHASAAGTPLSSLTQSISDPKPSGADDDRAAAGEAFEETMAQAARRADGLDDYWRRFRTACYSGRIVGTFAREWFALWDARAMPGAVARGCEDALADLKQQADTVRSRVLAALETARRADVYPGTRRDVLRRYRLEYAGWSQ